MSLFPNKEPSPNFSDQTFQNQYVEDTKSGKELLQKELDVNQAEQELLKKRVSLMRDFLNDIPSSDPQYGMISTSLQMDLVELDELKARQEQLINRLS